MDYETIKKIIKIAEESDISGLSVEKGDFKVEVKRDKGHHPVPVAPVHQVAHPVEEKGSSANPKQAEEDGLLAITSPMVGTFYRASSPDSPPYVEVGSEINEGTVVCIIEAMKLFNEIESEVSGKVVKILVENGKPVDYGQKLMLIKKR
ncbi:MAG: acetyl-CoA carboxylase biotin carboxyl carrier protein [Candidatus Saganbacteria bacterium]|nr:acetyl-CoA carboxylase biotin carboxyl carrier protein [Candidatus Saganbacteria bacterium]